MQGFSDDKARVLAATDIVRIIGDHVRLVKKGREMVGICPFHDDHNPSMAVVPAKQIYKCFSCGAGGDVFTFVMDYHKMSFPEALEHLAQRAGIELTPRPRRSDAGGGGGAGGWGGEGGVEVSRDDLWTANAVAAGYFRALLAHQEHGAAARAVLSRRGVSPAMVELFGIGASADRWDGFSMVLQSRSLPLPPYFAAGLLKRRGGGDGAGGASGSSSGQSGHYDSFRNRLMFPIHDMLGRVIAFGARRLNDADEPKYLNSSESAVFNKSATLYGLHQASQTIRTTGVCVVTEGYMDCIACHQAGLTNVVATLGTALTSQSARVLQRLCQKVILLFDGDDAGQRAADRAVEVLFAAELDVKIATLSSLARPGGAGEDGQPVPKDPDELLKQPDGRARLERVFADAADALEYRFARLRRRLAGLGLTAKAQAVDEELGRLAELGLAALSPIRRQLVTRKVAALAEVPEETVRRVIASAGVRRGRASNVDASGAEAPLDGAGWRPRSAAEHLLACAMSDPALLLGLAEPARALLAPAAFLEEPVKKVAGLLETIANTGQTWSTQAAIGALDDPAALRVATGMVAEVDRMTQHDPARLKALFDDCLATAMREHLTARARSSAGADETGTVVARLRAAQSLSASLGKDARALPKPLNPG